jgi:hypothetical protein
MAAPPSNEIFDLGHLVHIVLRVGVLVKKSGIDILNNSLSARWW